MEDNNIWNILSLKEYFEDRLKSIDDKHTTIREGDQRALSAALASSKEAITKAETATENRFSSVNEFRAALSDQTRSFVSRAEWLGVTDAMSKDIKANLEQTRTLVPRTEWQSSHDQISKDVNALGLRFEKYEANTSGKAAGNSTTWATIIIVVTILINMITVGAIIYTGHTPAAPPPVVYNVPIAPSDGLIK